MAKKSKSTSSKPRPKAVQLSKEVQARLSAFVNSSTEGFALLDDNLNYMFINPVAEIMIGVSRKAVVGKNILDIVPDVKELGRYDKYLKVLKTGEPFQIEDMVSHTKYRDIHAGLKVFRVENWLGLVFTDTTERKQAEEALRQSERNYRILFEGTLDGLFVVNAETGRIVLANRSAAKMFGFDSPEAMIGVYPINFVTPQDRNEVLRFVAEDVLRDLSEEWSRSDREAREIKGITNDGREIWLEIQGTPSEYQGKLAYLVSSKDITERKQAEETLRESEEKNRALVEAAGKAGECIGIVQTVEGLEAAFVFVNDEFCRMVGYSREELLSMKAQDVIHPAEFSEIVDRYRRRQKGENAPALYELTLVRKDGNSIPVEAGFGIMTYAGEVATVAFLRDTTERKKAEERIRTYERIIKTVKNPMSFIDRNYIYRAVNDAYLKIYGKSEEEIVGHKVEELMGKEVFEEQIKSKLDRCLNGEVIRTEDWFTFLTIGKRFMETDSYPVEANGVVSGVIVHIADITERKKAEEALEESEGKYRALIEAAGRGGKESSSSRIVASGKRLLFL
jgi:PAS domain S-box-containing protein